MDTSDKLPWSTTPDLSLSSPSGTASAQMAHGPLCFFVHLPRLSSTIHPAPSNSVEKHKCHYLPGVFLQSTPRIHPSTPQPVGCLLHISLKNGTDRWGLATLPLAHCWKLRQKELSDLCKTGPPPLIPMCSKPRPL